MKSGENVTIRASASVDTLHGSAGAGGGSRHAPALAAVVDAFDQHTHASHPRVVSTDARQQHPPRHTLVPQSNDDAHPSPGKRATHAPVRGEQLLHPMRTASGEQHAPPRHAPVAHVALAEHAAPGACGTFDAVEVGDDAGEDEARGDVVADAVADIELEDVPMDVAVALVDGDTDDDILTLADKHPLADGDTDPKDDCEEEPVLDDDTELEALGDTDTEPVPHSDTEGELDTDTEPVELGVGDTDTDADGVANGDCEGELDLDADAEPEVDVDTDADVEVCMVAVHKIPTQFADTNTTSLVDATYDVAATVAPYVALTNDVPPLLPVEHCSASDTLPPPPPPAAAIRIASAETSVEELHTPCDASTVTTPDAGDGKATANAPSLPDAHALPRMMSVTTNPGDTV